MQAPITYETLLHAFAYACFACRKSFKRPWVSLRQPVRMDKAEAEAFYRRNRLFQQSFGHRCPQCGQDTHFMGHDFKPPKVSDKKAWAQVEAYIRSGHIYYRGYRMPERAQRIGKSFYWGRALLNAVRQAGLTVDDIPEMYHHQVPKFISKLKSGRR